MNIEFRKFTDFNRGIMYEILKDAYSFDERCAICWDPRKSEIKKQKEEGSMEKYIEGNKAAWEEAFDNRDVSWGADIVERIQKEEYAFLTRTPRKKRLKLSFIKKQNGVK